MRLAGLCRHGIPYQHPCALCEGELDAPEPAGPEIAIEAKDRRPAWPIRETATIWLTVWGSESAGTPAGLRSPISELLAWSYGASPSDSAPVVWPDREDAVAFIESTNGFRRALPAIEHVYAFGQHPRKFRFDPSAYWPAGADDPDVEHWTSLSFCSPAPATAEAIKANNERICQEAVERFVDRVAARIVVEQPGLCAIVVDSYGGPVTERERLEYGALQRARRAAKGGNYDRAKEILTGLRELRKRAS